MARTHLQLMSKPRLIETVHRAIHKADQLARERDYWKAYAERLASASRIGDIVGIETSRALKVLALYGPDPNADTHRQILEQEILDWDAEVRSAAARKAAAANRKPGPRCTRGATPCGKLLGLDGLCPRCDHRARRASREGVAA